MTDKTSTLKLALLIRKTEERLLQAFADGEVGGTMHACIGQEFAAGCLQPHLEKNDFIFSNHRGHGHYLAATNDVDGLVAEMFGRASGCSAGRGGSQHLRAANFLSSGIQGGLLPIAAGYALGLREKKSRGVSIAFIGDGTLGQGVLYETMNLAALWKLPIVFVLEDNGIAQSTPMSAAFTGSVADRVKGFAVAYLDAETSDRERLSKRYEEALARARGGEGPAFVHVKTARLRAHSKSDDTRSPEVVRALQDRDALAQELSALSEAERQKIESELDEKVRNAVDRARSSPRSASMEEARSKPREWKSNVEPISQTGFFRHALTKAFHELFGSNRDVYFLGEDVQDPYGGCFKVSEGLANRYPQRVLNTPISEAAIAGAGIGLALAGRPTFVEFMFGDFVALAFDQIVNHAAKLAEAHRVPVVFRTPMGGGQGYGPTHSQNLEKHFLGVPHLSVWSANCYLEPSKLLCATLQAAPALLVETKSLYRQAPGIAFDERWRVQQDLNRLDLLIEPLGEAARVTLVTHGAYADIVGQAAVQLQNDFKIAARVLILARLDQVDASVDGFFLNGSPVLTFEEGVGYASVFAELAAQLAGRGVLVERWSAPADHLISASLNAEKQDRLSVAKVIAEVLEVLS